MAKKDEEGGEKKLPYPKSVFFIISTEFCERFSFYGMKSKFPNINKKKTISSLLLNKRVYKPIFVNIFWPNSLGTL